MKRVTKSKLALASKRDFVFFIAKEFCLNESVLV